MIIPIKSIEGKICVCNIDNISIYVDGVDGPFTVIMPVPIPPGSTEWFNISKEEYVRVTNIMETWTTVKFGKYLGECPFAENNRERIGDTMSKLLQSQSWLIKDEEKKYV
jgi:hypothetical protein